MCQAGRAPVTVPTQPLLLHFCALIAVWSSRLRLMKRSLIYLLSSVWLLLAPAASAHDGHTHAKPAAPPRDSLAVSLTADADGRIWLLEVRAGFLSISHSDDGGKTFSVPARVNAVAEKVITGGQNRPQIALTQIAGEKIVVVAWAQALEKRFASRVRLARSSDGGRSFTAPRTINDDGKDNVNHGDVALVANAAGEVTLVWIDGRDAAAGQYGSALYMARSADAAISFERNRRLVEQACECCQLALANDADGRPLLLWRHIFDGKYRDFALAKLTSEMHIERASTDLWALNGCPDHGGALSVGGDGTRHWVWFTGAAENPGLFYRHQRGETLSAAMPFGNPAAQSGFPVIWADRNEGQRLHMAWREFENGRYVLRTRRSQDGGMSWSPVRRVATSSGKVDQPLFVAGAGVPLLAWNTASEGLRVFDLESLK